MTKTILLAAILALCCACAQGGGNMQAGQPDADAVPLENAVIAGSAENPDPVLARVMALEKAGLVRDVVVQESFPVQIRLRASRQVIDELERMPRVGGLR